MSITSRFIVEKYRRAAVLPARTPAIAEPGEVSTPRMTKAVEIIVKGVLLNSESENISKVLTQKRWMHRLTLEIEELSFSAKRVVGRKQLMETLAPGTKLSFVCTEARMRALMGEAPENGTPVEFSGSYTGTRIIALSAAKIL